MTQKLSEMARVLVCKTLKDHISECETEEQRALKLGEILQPFHPDDISYFVKLFINHPKVTERVKPQPEPVVPMHPAEYNESQPPFLKVKWGPCQLPDRPPVKRCKVKSSSKAYRKATRPTKRAMSELSLAYPPVGDLNDLHRWMTKAVKWMRYSGKDIETGPDGLKSPPSHLHITCTMFALVYNGKREKRKASVYRIQVLLDRLNNKRFTLWSEYSEEEAKTISPEMFIVVQRGKEVSEVKFI